MSERATPAVMAALKEVLQRQIDAGDPPEARLTLARLLGEGMSDDEAWRWLSAVMLQEMSIMIRDNRPFDRAGYAAALDRLPGLIDR
ncbi:MAG: hypothetical protein Q7S20_12910 [Gemmatimonadaceae bacterium]|nr:hypothetical protein [Gemmatimonadaceae bacterium]